MSSVYITEPPTRGKVIVHTSHGDVDIELWPREAPLACRNFITLCMRGYYKNMIFHRVIKGLFIQTGDPTGTGRGGESASGGYFADEFHPRLRFNHRGCVATANLNVPDTNGSQFFITLDKCPWLDKKHTIFGKVTGNTIYNVLRMGDVETDKEDRPLEPPRLLGIEILDNPFPDLAEEESARATAAAAEAAAVARADAAAAKSSRNKLAAKQLSFADEDEEDAAPVQPRKAKIVSAHEMLASRSGSSAGRTTLLALDDSADDAADAPSKLTAGARADLRSRGQTDVDAAQEFRGPPRRAEADRQAFEDTRGLAAASLAVPKDRGSSATEQTGHPARAGADAAADDSRASSTTETEYNRVREQIRAARQSLSSAAAKPVEESKSILTPLQMQRAKFMAKKRGAGGAREMDTLAKLERFTSKLRSVATTSSAPEPSEAEAYEGQVLEDADRDDTDDRGWMTAKLKFKRHVDDAYRNADDGLVTVDPLLEGGEGGARKRRRD